VALSVRHAKPAIYVNREFVAAGGLMSTRPQFAVTAVAWLGDCGEKGVLNYRTAADAYPQRINQLVTQD
jgi:hypothetical protein